VTRIATPAMRGLHRVLFALFFASGFCSLLYQVIWLRLAFTNFGIITPVLSVVLSAFMLGLGLGSWLAGCRVERAPGSTRSPALYYGVVEVLIGTGAWVVPALFVWGEGLLRGVGATSSTDYLLLSSLLIAISLLGYTVLMGTTFPLMMAFIRHHDPEADSSFSFLYLANVIGAMCGAGLTALVLVESFGFTGTLRLAAAMNLAIGLVSFYLAWRLPRVRGGVALSLEPVRVAPKASPESTALHHGLLFMTGLTALAMEVVWTRGFTPVLQTTIYAFAALLTVYLAATWLGSYGYRRHLRRGAIWSTETLLGVLVVASLLPLIFADPRLRPNTTQLLLGIVLISALLGYLTPKLIDEYSRGDPARAGRAYAVNVAGCILGPLFAAYVLLPYLGVKGALLLLALTYLSFFALRMKALPRRQGLVMGTAIIVTGLLALVTTTFEDPRRYKNGEVRRDYTATTVSYGEGLEKRLLVNGVGITILTPVTKFMAHLPMVYLRETPRQVLVICFGMGTTFRSLVSWGVQSTAVELVPSVRDSFGFYFADARQVLARPNGQVIIDDGRRFLKRTDQRFDLITLDPPPPVEAAGSSLLYSVEFYRLVRDRLTPHGVLQQWFPGGEPAILTAVTNSLHVVFPHVKVYRSIEGWGYHFLASDARLEAPTAEAALARMPPASVRDLMEWFPDRQPVELWRDMLRREVPMQELMPHKSARLAIVDDRPFNEYFWMRRTLELWRHALESIL
jgi:spermidine synthase